MISPELLRRYPFFGAFDEAEIGDIAMIAEEVFYQAGDPVFEVDQPAAALYVLVEGSVELWYVAADKLEPDLRKEFYISEFNPGDVFGISALIEPYVFTMTALVTGATRLIKIDGVELRRLCQLDPKMEAAVMHRLAKVAMDRLHDTRVQLLAARA
jgi:CRP-like cAMP-binding protein